MPFYMRAKNLKRGGWALALGLLMAALAAAPALAVSVTPKVELDRDVVLLGDKRPVYVLVEFKVPEEKLRPGVKRPPVNLAPRTGPLGLHEGAGKDGIRQEGGQGGGGHTHPQGPPGGGGIR